MERPFEVGDNWLTNEAKDALNTIFLVLNTQPVGFLLRSVIVGHFRELEDLLRRGSTITARRMALIEELRVSRGYSGERFARAFRAYNEVQGEAVVLRELLTANCSRMLCFISTAVASIGDWHCTMRYY